MSGPVDMDAPPATEEVRRLSRVCTRSAPPPEINQGQSRLYPAYVSSCVRSTVRLKGERSVGHGWWSDPGGTYLGAASEQHPIRRRSHAFPHGPEQNATC